MSKIIDFYSGTGTDHRGRTLDDMIKFTDQELESGHDFVQWLFPLRVPSKFSDTAPVLTDADVAEFHKSEHLKDNLRRAFGRMLSFYKFNLEPDAIQCLDPHPWWANPRDHNLLRLTRILTSTRILDLVVESSVFLMHLEQISRSNPGKIPAKTLEFWQATRTEK